MIIIKTEEEIKKIRASGRITALALERLAKAVAPGVCTEELDRIAEEFLLQNGAVPAFKGYRGFPKSVTISINEEVVHGIPGKRRLKKGDIVGIDLGTILDGYYSDAAITVPVGKIKPEHELLLQVTREALEKGIREARAGNRIGDISHAVQSHVEQHGFSVVRDLVGHGIGRAMHEDPQVPNYGQPGQGVLLEEGMVLAIEPMVNAGGYEVLLKEDQWTVITADRKCSAHFEHTVAITRNGPLVLTVS